MTNHDSILSKGFGNHLELFVKVLSRSLDVYKWIRVIIFLNSG